VGAYQRRLLHPHPAKINPPSPENTTPKMETSKGPTLWSVLGSPWWACHITSARKVIVRARARFPKKNRRTARRELSKKKPPITPH
jgi:hypothetical protein